MTLFNILVLTGHTHRDKPDAYICPQFLIGRCDKGSACTALHCSLPYHWQYKVSLFDEWECFTNKDNLALEKLYCDVNVGMLVNFKPAGSFDLSRLQRQVFIDFKVKLQMVSNRCCQLYCCHWLPKFWYSSEYMYFSCDIGFY